MPAGSILVADDDTAIRTVLNQALSRAGYEVRLTGNAATLWRWVSQGEGDLVITDVVMPELSGRQVADEVRMLQPEVGVLFMSGFSEGTTGSPVDSVADLDLVQKPFSERTLLARVRGALTTHR